MESSLQTSRALIAPLMRLAADTEERRRMKERGGPPGKADETVSTATDVEYSAEGTRDARARGRVAARGRHAPGV